MISFEQLRKILKEKGITTYYLKVKCAPYNIDNKTLQRLMSDESVTTNTLNSLCNIFDCDLSDIMTFTPDHKKPDTK